MADVKSKVQMTIVCNTEAMNSHFMQAYDKGVQRGAEFFAGFLEALGFDVTQEHIDEFLRLYEAQVGDARKVEWKTLDLVDIKKGE